MKPVRSTLAAWLLIALGLSSLPFASPIRAAGSSEALTPAQARAAFSRSERLDRLVTDTARAAVAKFGQGGLGENKLALTVIDLNDREQPRLASYRGQEMIYPASVVKLFYLAFAHQQLEAGVVKQSADLDRALRDMIVESSNDATHAVVDVVTGTTAGPELDEAALREWIDKRNAMNRYFASLGYEKINVNQKTWCEGPYGRERQGLGPNFENRNKLTTEATARLMYEIARRGAVSRPRSRQMLDLLRRNPFEKGDEQATDFTGKALPPGSELYSKAGWTSTTRHDVAYVRLPNGAEYVLAVFTVDNARNTEILPFVSKTIAEDFMKTQPAADLILTNGRVWTGSKQPAWAEAVAARGERLIAVGSSEEIKRLADAKTRVVDLQGRLALPGFIDDHTHFMTGGFHLLSVELRDARTPQEFAERIKKHAAKLPKGRWVSGGDWDHEQWGGELPRRDWIDGFTADHPVFVSRLDGHMGLANSAALKIAGITKETPSPAGGTIVKDSKTGEPTGVLKDDAMGLVSRFIPDESDAEYEEALKASLDYAARVGVTSIQDITSWRDYEVYKKFHDAGRLTVRVYARTPMSQWKRQADLVRRQGVGDHWLRLGGLKAFMDGSLGSTTALFFEPFTDAPHTAGLSVEDNIPEGKLKETMKEADKAGLQCSIHAIGDKANNLLLNYFEAIGKENGKRDRRFRIEHAQHLAPADIPRFAKLGVIASMQPYHAADDGRWAEKRIGKERIKTTYAFRSLLDAGAVLTFGSDWFVAPLSPILGIHAAVTRQTIDGKNPKGWVPEQKITVEEAIRAYTSAGAYAEFAENDKGVLEVGKLADIVVLSQDLFKINPNDIEKTKVDYTVVGGRVVRGQ